MVCFSNVPITVQAGLRCLTLETAKSAILTAPFNVLGQENARVSIQNDNGRSQYGRRPRAVASNWDER
jgi:hypothetical protein